MLLRDAVNDILKDPYTREVFVTTLRKTIESDELQRSIKGAVLGLMIPGYNLTGNLLGRETKYPDAGK